MNSPTKPTYLSCIRNFLFFFFLFFFSACEDDPFEANSGTFTDARDGHEYEWVKIGEQIWLAENLAYVPYVCAPDSQCGIWIYDYYGEGSYGNNYHTYGCLYDWETALQICPEGWHIPSDEEWMELERFLGMNEEELYEENLVRGEETNASGKLGAGSTLWNEKNNNATNETGFSATPGGSRVFDGSGWFWGIKNAGTYWSSTYHKNGWIILRTMESGGITRGKRDKRFGYSIRCVKD